MDAQLEPRWHCTATTRCQQGGTFGTLNYGTFCSACGIARPGSNDRTFRMGTDGPMAHQGIQPLTAFQPAVAPWIEKNASGVWMYHHNQYTSYPLPGHLQERERFRFQMGDGRTAEWRSTRGSVIYFPATLEFQDSEISDSDTDVLDPVELAARTVDFASPFLRQPHNDNSDENLAQTGTGLYPTVPQISVDPNFTRFNPGAPNDYGTAVQPFPRFNPLAENDYGTLVEEEAFPRGINRIGINMTGGQQDAGQLGQGQPTNNAGRATQNRPTLFDGDHGRTQSGTQRVFGPGGDRLANQVGDPHGSNRNDAGFFGSSGSDADDESSTLIDRGSMSGPASPSRHR